MKSILCLVTVFSCSLAATFTTTTLPIPYNTCYRLDNGPSYTVGMEKGDANFLYHAFIEGRQKVKIECAVPSSQILSNDTFLSLSVAHIDGEKSVIAIGNGVKSITAVIECGTNALLYYPDIFGYLYQIKENVFCEVSKGEQKSTTKNNSLPQTFTTTSTRPIFTTTPTTISKCTECSVPKFLQRTPSAGFESGIVTFSESYSDGCKFVEVNCVGANPTASSFTRLTIPIDVYSFSQQISNCGNGTTPISLKFKCDDRMWSWTMNGQTFYRLKLDYIFCEVRKNESPNPATEVPNELAYTKVTVSPLSILTPIYPSTAIFTRPLFTTTSLPLSFVTRTTTVPSFTTRPPTTTTVPIFSPSNATACAKNQQFKILSSKVDPSFSRQGKFGGFYKLRSICKNLCKQSYGMFNACFAFMYEPKNHGKCTIFDYSVDGRIAETSNSNAVILKKCY